MHSSHLPAYKWGNAQVEQVILNPFQDNVHSLYPMKTSEGLKWKGTLAGKGLTYFIVPVSFSTPWKHQKTRGFQG